MTVSPALVDTETLRAVLRDPGPVAAVYAGPAPAAADEYQLEWTTRWRPLGEALRRAGADRATVQAVSGAVTATAGARAAHAMTEVAAFAREGHLLAAVPAPGARWSDEARFSAPAHVLPLLEWLQDRPPHVLVVTDRTGAEIETFPGGGSAGTAISVRGPDDEIERNAPGGFLAQGRYQRRAEDSWKHNAGAVAAHVVDALDRGGARLLVVSGDVRAVQLLREALPERVQRGVDCRQISGSRAADGSQQRRADQLARVVRDAAQQETDALLRQLAEERSPEGRAVEGEDATLGALAAGRVATLLVQHSVIDDPRQAWCGPGPADVRPGTRPRPAWPDLHRGPLLDVAVRSALLTGARVRVVPSAEAPAEGLGGICRFR